MASTDNHPEEDKLVKSNYKASLVVYGEDSGITYFDFTNQRRVKYFVQQDDPSVAVMPIIRIGVLLTPDEKILIQENRSDIAFNIKMSRIDKQWDSETDAYLDVTEEALFDLKFQAFMAGVDNTSLKSDDKKSIEEDENGELTASDMKSATTQEVVEFIISCVDHRNEFKLPINFNHTAPGDPSATVFGALALGISKVVKTPKSVVLQKPDNSNTYNQIICPPYNIKDFCNHLQTVYGVYDNGILIYRDLDYLYVIPKHCEKYDVPEDEYAAVHIFLYDQQITALSEHSVGGYTDESSQRYVLLQAARYSFANLDEYAKETIGNKFMILSDDTVDGSVTYEGENFGGSETYTEYETLINGSNTSSGDRIRYFHDELNNPSRVKELVSNTNLQIMQCQVPFRDVDINTFKFNRTYTLIFNDDSTLDAKYGGEFKLMKVLKSISQGDGDEPMSAELLCTFAKVK